MGKYWLRRMAAVSMTAALTVSSLPMAAFAEGAGVTFNGGEAVASVNGATATIGNGSIVREFSIADGKVKTAKIDNKRANQVLTPEEGSEEFVIKRTKTDFSAQKAIEQDGWTATADSEEKIGESAPAHGYAKNIIDNNEGTFWHTQYKDEKGDLSNKPGMPHQVVIGLGKATSFKSFSYNPRYTSANGTAINGNIKQYELWTSKSEEPPADDSGDGWTKVAEGEFNYTGNKGEAIHVNIEDDKLSSCENVKHVKLVAKSSVNNNEFAGGEEFDLYAEKWVAPQGEQDMTIESSELTLADENAVTCEETVATVNGEQKTGEKLSFRFKPITFNGVEYTITENIVMYDGDHYMRKFMDISVPEDQADRAEIDYIDLESVKLDSKDTSWTVPLGQGGIVEMEEFKANLGQPFYVDGMFFGCEFPVADTHIDDNKGEKTARSRYYTGKTFSQLQADGQAGKAEDGKVHYSTWQTVAGAARSTDNSVIQSDFFDYIDDISVPADFRIQYNSWFDNMMEITDENIQSSFKEIDKGLVANEVRPLDSYVIDDGWNNYNDTENSVSVSQSGTGKNKSGFWELNSKFLPNGFGPSSELVRDLGSDFGVWLGPRGGYNFQGHLGNVLVKSGKGSKANGAGGDIDVANRTYVKELEKFFIQQQQDYGVNYWKLDGFAQQRQFETWSATDGVPSRAGEHMVGGTHQMYHVTDLWEAWIDLMEGIRSPEATANVKNLWISLTSYVNPSPWYLQWANSVWLQCGPDQAGAGKSASDRSDSQMDRQLNARDAHYYNFLKDHQFQFPMAHIYNHDPVYGKSGTGMTKDTATGEQFQNYLYTMAGRGTAFWELYFSDSMLDDEKYEVTGEFLAWAEQNFHMLKNIKMFGSSPASNIKLNTGNSVTSPTVEIYGNGPFGTYGYAGFDGDEGILTIRNADWNKAQDIEFTVDDATFGLVGKNGDSYDYVVERHYNREGKKSSVQETGTFEYGKKYTWNLQPEESLTVHVTKKGTGDKQGPSVSTVASNGNSAITVRMDEKVKGDASFTINGEKTSDDKVKRSADDLTFHVELAEAPKHGDEIEVKVSGITDMAGNALEGNSGSVVFHKDGVAATRSMTSLTTYAKKVASAKESLTSETGFTVLSTVKTSGSGSLLKQEGAYELGIDETGKAYFDVNGVRAVSDGVVNDGAGHTVAGVRENNGIVKVYVDGQVSDSAYDAKNLRWKTPAGSITFAGGKFDEATDEASAKVLDRALGYDEVAAEHDSVFPDMNVRNLARGKNVEAKWTVDDSDAAKHGDCPMDRAVDGSHSSSDSYGEFGTDQRGESSYMQVDLGDVYELTEMNLWRYWKVADRQYKDTLIAVSEDADFGKKDSDPSDDKVIFNADKAGVHGFGNGTQEGYAETADGHKFEVPAGTKARYVRVYMNGRTDGNTNHVVEFEVMGKPVAKDQNRIDTTQLDKRIADLDALMASGEYTDESVEKVSAIVDAARKVANNPESDQAVADALKTLENLESKLEKNPVVTPPTPDQGDDKVTIEKHPDGSQTVTTKGDDGSKTVVEIDKSGKVTSVDATVSQDAAKDGSATLPMEGLEQTSSKNAPTIKVDVPASVSKDDPLAITVPVAKAKGEKTVDPGLVVVKVDKDGKQTVLPKTAFGADGVTVEVDGDCEIKVVDAAKTFPDVKDSDWFAAEVVPFATARGILNGVAAPDGSREFQGDGETSRAMFVAMLSNLELGPKAQSGSSFADVPGDAWYANAAAWAAENGLVEGKGGTSFDGEGEVTREQIAVFLMRYADFLGLDTSARTDVDFPDADEVSEWAREAMSWAVAEGLFTGNGVTGELDPASGATRAETATVLMRFINQMYA